MLKVLASELKYKQDTKYIKVICIGYDKTDNQTLTHINVRQNTDKFNKVSIKVQIQIFLELENLNFLKNLFVRYDLISCHSTK